MNKQYKKSDYHNYIVFPVETEKKLEQKMLLNNKIAGLLPCKIQKTDREITIEYEIDGRITLEQYLQNHPLVIKDFLSLYGAILNTIKGMRTYFLPPSRLLLEEDAIFFHSQTMKLEFCCVPNNETDIMVQLKSLTELLLRFTDHKDKEGVLFIYGLYQMLGQVNTSMAMIETYVLQKKEEMAIKPVIYEEKEEKIEEISIPVKKIDVEMLGQSQKEDTPFQIKEEKRTAKKMMKKEKKRNKEKTKETLSHYILQWMTGVLFLLFLCFTIRFFFTIQWKNAILGIIITAVTGYVIWERQVTYQKKKGMGKQEGTLSLKRPVIKEKSSLTGEETVVLVEREPVMEQKEERVPCLKPVKEIGTTIQLVHMPLVIGSLPEAVDFVLKEKGVSRIHACIEQEEESYYIRDLNSTNGTRWNGEMLYPQIPRELKDGDIVGIGNEEYLFQF